MSIETSSLSSSSTEKRKNRPCVSSKSLLNIRSIVAQNLTTSSNNRTLGRHPRASLPPPLPLVDSLVSTKEPIKNSDNSKEIEEQNRKYSSAITTSNTFEDTKGNTSGRRIMQTNGHDQKTVENTKSKSTSIELLKTSIGKIEQEKANTSTIVVHEAKSKRHTSSLFSSKNKNGQTNIAPLPLTSSAYYLGSFTTSPQTNPLSSVPTQSSAIINEEYLAQLCATVKSPNSSNESKSNKISMHKSQLLSINQFDLISPNTLACDEENEDAVSLTQPIQIVNSSLNLSTDRMASPTTSIQNFKLRLSERTEKEYRNCRRMSMNHPSQYITPNPRFPTSYTRLPHALSHMNPSFNKHSQSNMTGSSTYTMHPTHRRFPQSESVRTPVDKSSLVIKQQLSSTISPELFNCCQTKSDFLPETLIKTEQYFISRNSQRQSTTIETSLNECETRSNYFRDLSKIREIMINVSNRLTKDIDSNSTLPLVDTHCHFDLIFDRLRIKHNDLRQYFKDFSEYYPLGLSFELAIQVFWRPKQLTKSNWTNWFSKYLDDERVYGACGIHPHWSSEWKETSVTDIERCLEHPKIVAIGEIGLDFGPKNECLIHQQRRAFEAQLILAAKWSKPIVIHSRDAYQETFALMKQHLQADHKVHLHCFVGTMDDVNLFTAYFTEIKFGFTPIITRSNFLHTTIQQLELTQILSETDSPYFTPNELNSLSRCAHPGMVYSVVEMIAQLRHLPVIDVAYQLRENARHIYGV